MNRNIFAKIFFVLTVVLGAFSCSNYFGLSVAEREQLKMKDKPALSVERLPTILPCKKVEDHYEVEVLSISEKNLRFPKTGDNYVLKFEALVSEEVAITSLKASAMSMTFDIPIDAPITSSGGKVLVEQKIVFPEELPNLRIAFANLKIVAVVQCSALGGVDFTLTDQLTEHIESDNVEIEYVFSGNPELAPGQVAVTFKNGDGSVFATVTGYSGTPLVAPKQIPKWRGHVFVKWIDVPKVFPLNNAECEALWDYETYYINYELNGGVNSRGNPDSYTEKDGVLKLYPPSKGDSVFCGWYTDSNFYNAVTEINAGRRNDITLYAKWLEKVVGQISMHPTNIIMVGGQAEKIQYYLKMADGTTPDLEWSYSEPGVVSVEADGTVKANIVPFDSENPARSVKRITATASYKSLKASCQITVIPTVFTREILAEVWPEYDKLTDFTIPYGVEKLADHVFDNSRVWNPYASLPSVNFVSIEIPETVTVIGECAFMYCESLTGTLKLPSGIKEIPDWAFYACESLENVVIPDGVKRIGEVAFDFCYSLKGSLELPKELEELGSDAFGNCKSLENVVIPKTLEIISSDAFYNCESLENVVIPDGVKRIGDHAFYNCCSLKGPLELPKELEELGSYAFANCKSLENVVIPESIKNISSYAFADCESLEGVIFEEGVENIYNSAFSGCSSIKGPLVLPKSLKTINSCAFKDCSSLKEVKIPADNKLESVYGDYYSITFSAFPNVTTVTITGTLSSYDAEHWNKDILYGFHDLVELNLENAPDYITIDGALYTADKTRLVYVPRCNVNGLDATNNNEPMFKIPDSVTHIGDYALYGWGLVTPCRLGFPKTSDCKIVSYGDYCLAVTNWNTMSIVNTTKFVGKGILKDSNLRNGVIFDNTYGWYYTTDPNATSGTPVDVSDAIANGANLKAGGAWADGYLKRN